MNRLNPIIQTLTLSVGACALGFAGLAHASANGLEALDAFIKTTKNGRAEFTQTVTSPKADKVKLSRGVFEFLRPNRFKFTYTKPFEQTIVADGQTLWLYDVDLNQVTARKQSAAMVGSPAALFAAAADLRSIQAEFNIANAPDKDGLQWITATPKSKSGADSKEGLIQTVRIGFRQTERGMEIGALEMLDSFGQNSRIHFEKIQINTALGASDFVFTPPKGADVMKQ